MPPGVSDFFKAFWTIMTKRSSAFHNILLLDSSVFFFSYLVYLKANTLWVFVPALVILTYTLYSHEWFARKQPHLLSGEKTVQELGIRLGAMGDSKNIVSENAIESLEPTTNPESLEIKASDTAATEDLTRVKKNEA